jgi:hypothetical protein
MNFFFLGGGENDTEIRGNTDMAEGEGVGRDGAEMRCPRGRLVGFLGEVTTLHNWRRGD